MGARSLQRRRLRNRLVKLGWRSGPRAVAREGRGPVPRVELPELLRSLGPGFAAFGGYLAGRADLLAAPLRAELARMCREGLRFRPAGDPLRQVPSAAWVELDPHPRPAGLAGVELRGRLRGGRAVRVLLVDPEHAAELRADLELLPLLEESLEALDLPAAELFAAFRQRLELELDLRARERALGILARDFQDSDLLRIPRVLAPAGPWHLLLEDSGGRPPDEAARGAAGPGAWARASVASALVRRLALAWLELVLVAGKVPCEPDFVELGDGRLGLGGTALFDLPAASRAELWRYLAAVASDRPDAAAASLLAELGLRPGEPKAEAFRRRMRQLVPFRDSAWSEAETGEEAMAEYLLLNWRLCRELGLASPRLDELYASLLELGALCRRLAPGRDALREGLESLGWRAGWAQLRLTLAPERAPGAALAYMRGMLELPRSLRRAMEATRAEGDVEEPAAGSPDRAWGRATVGLCLLAAMAAVSLWAAFLSGDPSLGSTASAAGGVLFLILGAAFLLRNRLSGARRGG